MENLLTARVFIALSLAFHIIFAMAGMTLPLLMVIAEGMWLKTKDPQYLAMAKKWGKLTGILFAIGAVTGTLISFELGLLWPRFMAFAGPIFGLPFAIEGFAFFMEAIFLGIYLYGWDKVGPRAHWIAGWMVFLGAAMSGIFITAANGWMNTPQGFDMVNGHAVNIDPIAAILNPAAFFEVPHMVLAAYQSIGFLFAGIYALLLLKRPASNFYRRAMIISLMVGGICALINPIVGDLSAKHIAKNQPMKLAAAEGHWETQKEAPLIIGGWPSMEEERTKFGIEIPYALSLMAFGDKDAEVKGLKEVPREDRPNVPLVHMAFQVMVGAGTFMAGVFALWLFLTWRKKTLPMQQWMLGLIALAAPMGIIATEAGWIVTEVGRQPWVVQGIMRTSEGVTPVSNLGVPLVLFLLIFVFLGVIVCKVCHKLITDPKYDDSNIGAANGVS